MSKTSHELYFEFLDELKMENTNMYSATDALKLKFNLPTVIATEILQEWFEQAPTRKQILHG